MLSKGNYLVYAPRTIMAALRDVNITINGQRIEGDTGTVYKWANVLQLPIGDQLHLETDPQKRMDNVYATSGSSGCPIFSGMSPFKTRRGKQDPTPDLCLFGIWVVSPP